MERRVSGVGGLAGACEVGIRLSGEGGKFGGLVASSSLAALAPVWVGEAGPICQS